ncbi:MAG: hypothetical protein B7Y80_06615 [Hyphomicrobium sp. 32-62-53]|nr:MAG: hypothetical protein B7Z29_04905 [Hyphomicrobium sp. 12-62-95]OYY00298.1 MAG: hypothetical protein B7Y80_06615 [Hyphomicrobium sp. 32-62-53]
MGNDIMFELLARLFRVLWRQDSEGTGGSAVILDFPAATAVATQDAAVPVAAPVVFIRKAGEVTASPGGHIAAAPSRHLSAQLHSVSRLNGPSSRARIGSAAAPAKKPKPMAAPAALKRTPAVRPGVVIGRLSPAQKRTSAAIVDLAEVRADVRRAKQVESVDQEIVALFH